MFGLGADNGGLDTVKSQHVVNLFNDELSKLLKISPEGWLEVGVAEVEDVLGSSSCFNP